MNDYEAIMERVELARLLSMLLDVPIITAQQNPVRLAIPRLPADSFDWIRWRAFSLFYDLAIPHRTVNIVQNKHRIAEKAVGYCKGEELLCRPKPGTFAVMFDHNGEWQWCHLRREEFTSLFRA